MTTYNTGNPLGSTAVKDLYDNAENLDTAVNDTSRDTWSDRLGRSRKTMSGMEREFNADQDDRDARFKTFIASSGYQFLGDYAAGIEITEYNQIVRDADGEFWRVSGQVDLPYTTTGAGLPEGDALTPLGDAVLRQELANPDMGASMVRFRQEGEGAVGRSAQQKFKEIPSILDFGAVGDGVTDDTLAVNKAITNNVFNGAGKTYLVDTLPNFEGIFNATFRHSINGSEYIRYPTKDVSGFELSKITNTPYYASWVQDKAFTYNNVIYFPFGMADKHGTNDYRVAWVKSYDNGLTYTAPEIVVGYHSDSDKSYHCMSMGVNENRLIAVIEVRRKTDMLLLDAQLWDKVMPYTKRLNGGIVRVEGESFATVTVENHSLRVGDSVWFSASGVPGVSGNLIVSSVLDLNTFIVPTAQTTAGNNAGKYWYFGAGIENEFNITSLGTIPSFVDGTTPVTEVHSYTSITPSSFAVGYHNGDIGPREVGILYFESFYSNPSSFIRRRIPSDLESDAGEPCITWKNGVLYLTTRGTRFDRRGSILAKSSNLGLTWDWFRLPKIVHHSNVPLVFSDENTLHLFSSERAWGEWEANEPDKRYTPSYARSMHYSLDVREWDTSQNKEWECIGQTIYEGSIVNSGVGVGGAVYSNGKLIYATGGESFKNPLFTAGNGQRKIYHYEGHPSDIFTFSKILEDKQSNSDYRFIGVESQTLPVFTYLDGSREIDSNISFREGINSHKTLTYLSDYGSIVVKSEDPTTARLILSGGKSVSNNDGATITLYSTEHSRNRNIIYNGRYHVFHGGDIYPTTDGGMSLGRSAYSFNNIYLKNNPVITSDVRAKSDIESIDYRYFQVIALLDFKQFKMKEDAGGEIHFGVIAQDWVNACEACGVDPYESGVLVGSENEGYAIRYGELQSLIHAYILSKLS